MTIYLKIFATTVIFLAVIPLIGISTLDNWKLQNILRRVYVATGAFLVLNLLAFIWSR